MPHSDLQSDLQSKHIEHRDNILPAEGHDKTLFKSGDQSLRFLFQINAKDTKYLQEFGVHTYFSRLAKDIDGNKQHTIGRYPGNIVKGDAIVDYTPRYEGDAEVAIYEVLDQG